MAALRTTRIHTTFNVVRRFMSTASSAAAAAASSSTKLDPTQSLLKATLPFVPQYGWSMESMMRGARELGYPSVAHGVFEHGEASLVDAFLKQCRRQHNALIAKALATNPALHTASIGDKVREFTEMRLRLLEPYAHRWPEALAIMAYPTNVPMSLTHLAELADDVLYYAGDRSPDFDWYLNRAGYAAVYTSTELFMTQDRSENFAETMRFLDRRLAEAKQVESAKKEVGVMLEFGAKSFLGLLSTRGIRV
ncbi:COQ9-domain-containing protein [Dichotomocladium elegans]|nr:COQ9-domain-containing protein [Dichotomocladium elegans]